EALDESVLDGIDGPRLVFVNGAPVPRLSRLEALPEGLEFGFGAAESGSAYPRADEVFAQLNLALATGGVHLRVAPGLRVDAPLHLVFIGAPAGADLAVHLRHRVGLGAGARLVLVEHQLASGEHR